ncbi:alpha/beta fold hydrolase [Arthrobacter sp. TWP1-1]|uniref:alpha/beta hydrolase family protein n=1 Tax=Arthrobacter sp. TWP1-1 TaxID=2804568 RepID=UPI003CE8CF9B
MSNNETCVIDSVDLCIASRGGGQIRGTLRTPSDTEPSALVVVHPATAVPERLYSAFATYMAEQGFAVISYDYRGTGKSGSPKVNRSLRMRDWMDQDVPDVAEWAAAEFPKLPRFAIGHSVGGHALSLGSGVDGLLGMVSIASHAGVTATIPSLLERCKVWLILRVAGPLTGRVLGYVPGSKLGLGEDIPAGAMLEWSRWSRKPGYFFDDPSMNAAHRASQVTGPVLSIGFSDDPWATPQQIEAITDHLTAAAVERRTYSPADFGVAAIGHMGFFRRGLREGLWPEVVAWLREQERQR